MFPGRSMRDTWRCRAVPGWSPGWGHSAWALGTGGELGRHPEGFSRLGVLGTRGVLGMLPGMLSRLSTRGTWHARKVSGEITLAGRVAHSEASREISLAGLAAHLEASGVVRPECHGTRGVPGQCPGLAHPVGALGTRGVPGTLPGMILPAGLSGHVASREASRENLPAGLRGTT